MLSLETEPDARLTTRPINQQVDKYCTSSFSDC